MKQRNPLAVFLLGLITGGIYSLYWAVKTKDEMNKLGEKIPTVWVWLIPIVGSIWWIWKYSEGVEHVTQNKVSAVLAFILYFLLGNIGQAIIQNHFNEPTAPAMADPVQYTAPVVAQAPVATPNPSVDQPIVSEPATFVDQPVVSNPAPVQPETSQPTVDNTTPSDPTLS